MPAGLSRRVRRGNLSMHRPDPSFLVGRPSSMSKAPPKVGGALAMHRVSNSRLRVASNLSLGVICA
jgi:hypothetical protein